MGKLDLTDELDSVIIDTTFDHFKFFFVHGAMFCFVNTTLYTLMNI